MPQEQKQDKERIKQQDFSIRIPATDERIQVLEERCGTGIELPRITDIMYRPTNQSLEEFPPDKVCVRLRAFTDSDRPATLVKISTITTETGYTDQKEKLAEGEVEELIKQAQNRGYEEWGRMSTISVQYDFTLPDGTVISILYQKIDPVGEFLKIESPTQEGLRQALVFLSASEEEKIEKNAAVLLAEKLNPL